MADFENLKMPISRGIKVVLGVKDSTKILSCILLEILVLIHHKFTCRSHQFNKPKMVSKEFIQEFEEDP